MFNSGQQQISVQLLPSGGLNTSAHPADIADNELSIAYNVEYEAGTGKLFTRHGTRCEAVAQLATPIDLLFSFTRKDTESWLVCVSDSKLYKLDTGTWVEIAALSMSRPAMVAFNGKLYVADGAVDGLLSWDGTTAVRVAGSPQATAITTASNRLICNNMADGELDAVYISAPEYGDDWATANGALIIRAGYGDGLSVNGFAVISATLLVSKVGRIDGEVVKKNFYGVSMAGTPAEWSADVVSSKNAAVSPHAIESIGQDVIYVDSEGVEMLSPTQRYGDIATDPAVGAKINNSIGGVSKSAVSVSVVSIPSLASVWLLLNSSVYTFSKLTRAFTNLDFTSPIKTVCEHGQKVYLAGDSGYLYCLSPLGGDEAEPGIITPFFSDATFKMITGTGDLLLTKLALEFEYITAGIVEVKAVAGDGATGKLLAAPMAVSPSIADRQLYGANMEIAVADVGLSESGTKPRLSLRSRFRSDGIMIKIRTYDNARVIIGKVTPSIAQVGR